MRRTLLATVIVIALAVLCLGCDGEGSQLPVPSPAASRTAPEPTSAPSPERVRRMLVPSLRTVPVSTARTLVRGAGLHLEVARVLGTACRPRGEVLRQRPRAGAQVPVGSSVRVEANGGGMGRCGLGLPAAPPLLDRLARHFVAFARGEQDHPPTDTPVTLYLGGRQVATVMPDDPRATWQVCPPEGGYAGFVCPFSALEQVARAEQLAVTSRPPEHPCAHPRELGGAPYSVTITPDESLACPSYWGVQLIVNQVNQLTGVNLVRSEP